MCRVGGQRYDQGGGWGRNCIFLHSLHGAREIPEMGRGQLNMARNEPNKLPVLETPPLYFSHHLHLMRIPHGSHNTAYRPDLNPNPNPKLDPDINRT